MLPGGAYVRPHVRWPLQRYRCRGCSRSAHDLVPKRGLTARLRAPVRVHLSSNDPAQDPRRCIGLQGRDLCGRSRPDSMPPPATRPKTGRTSCEIGGERGLSQAAPLDEPSWLARQCARRTQFPERRPCRRSTRAARFIPVRIAVLTVSDTRALADDKSGNTLAAMIGEAGHAVAARALVKDDVTAIRAKVQGWIDDPG